MARLLPSPRTALGVLTGLNFLNYLDRFIPAAVLPAIIAELHLSGAEAGSMQLVFILSFAVISPVFGWLGDRRTRFSLAAMVSSSGAPRPSAQGWPPRSPFCWSRAR